MNTPLFLFLGDLGGGEIMLIMVVILIFFGANKIPELARGLGKGIREFKDASSEIRNEIENSGRPTPNQSYQQPQQPYQQPQQQPYAQHSTDSAPVPPTTVAPPMDGGVATPTQQPEHTHNRLDQTS
ncbi:Sec-independent protein translocase subunit TatA/TatB [Hymenobacter aerilatus]|uniref:Sec-independent protein translocase subunit TatA/TatB n=1 Tax=Hymenobacter aerilatus TaxID=2932251 RepID=UPI00288044B2|nr:twin-arginine translocase TatA/TatE family subunit [Hymenobacter aerilatus]